VKTHKRLWERVVSAENLLEAAREAMRGKRNRPPAARFFARWETEAMRLREDLLDGSYQPGRYSCEYIVFCRGRITGR
jgi:RNA-directed DNA polymerase